MDFFSEAMLRLKHELRVSKDSEVAELLGLGKTALSERKKRGSFPQKEVLFLAEARPELGLDAAYVLTGMRSAVHTALGAVGSASQLAARLGLGADEAAVLQQSFQLPADEQVLLTSYRQCTPEAKAKLMQQAALLAARIDLPEPPIAGTFAAPFPGSMVQTINAPVSGAVAGRDVNTGPPPDPKPRKNKK